MSKNYESLDTDLINSVNTAYAVLAATHARYKHEKIVLQALIKSCTTTNCDSCKAKGSFCKKKRVVGNSSGLKKEQVVIQPPAPTITETKEDATK